MGHNPRIFRGNGPLIRRAAVVAGARIASAQPGNSQEGHIALTSGNESGGEGIRTPVFRRLIKASPGAACCSFLSPSDLAGKSLRAQSLFDFPADPVTGSTGGALYRCQTPERGHPWADSSSYRQAARASRLLSAFIEVATMDLRDHATSSARFP